MKYLLLVLATIFASSKALLCKKIGQDNKNTCEVLFLNANIFLTSSLTILICFVNKIKSFFEISSFSLTLSLLFAAFLLFTQLTQIFSMSRGFASLTSLIFSCGFLIPIFYSALFLNETISIFQILGIALLIVALVVILPPSKDGKFSFLWLTFTIASMLGSGINAVIQKVHQYSDFKHELAPFIFFALLFASIFSLVLSFVIKENGTKKRRELYSKKSTVFLIVVDGFVVGLLNVANLKLSGTIPAIIHFPVYNICSMILTALAGHIFFGEKTGLRKLIGFVIGLCAITIIGLL